MTTSGVKTRSSYLANVEARNVLEKPAYFPSPIARRTSIPTPAATTQRTIPGGSGWLTITAMPMAIVVSATATATVAHRPGTKRRSPVTSVGTTARMPPVPPSSRVDRRRLDYVTDLLCDHGVDRRSAEQRSAIYYRVLIGEFSWCGYGGEPLSGQALETLLEMMLRR